MSDLLDVRDGVAPHARWIGFVGVVDLGPGDELTIRSRNPKIPRERLEAVTRQLADTAVIPAYGIHRVDQLAARCDEADLPIVLVAARRAATGAALLQAHLDAAERQRYSETARALVEERDVESMQVVVLDDVG